MWSPQNRHFCAKSIKNSRKQVKNGSFSANFWSKWRDSNSRPPVPETGALPTALHLVLMIFMRFSVSGQTCGQTENLRTFKTSGEPKKSVFSRGFSVFQNFWFEIGGLHPKLARYQLRYTSKIKFWIFAEWTMKLYNRAPRRAEQRRRIVVVRRSVHSLLQLVALGFRF